MRSLRLLCGLRTMYECLVQTAFQHKRHTRAGSSESQSAQCHLVLLAIFLALAATRVLDVCEQAYARDLVANDRVVALLAERDENLVAEPYDLGVGAFRCHSFLTCLM